VPTGKFLGLCTNMNYLDLTHITSFTDLSISAGKRVALVPRS